MHEFITFFIVAANQQNSFYQDLLQEVWQDFNVASMYYFSLFYPLPGCILQRPFLFL